MPVRVIPVGVLRPSPSKDDIVFEAACGQTVHEMLRRLAIEPDLVAMVLINGRQVPKDTVLRDGDLVKLIPFVGGG